MTVITYVVNLCIHCYYHTPFKIVVIMTILNILSPHEKRQFDSPPTFNTSSRALHFAASNDIMTFIETLHTATSKVVFVLQLGYFRSHAKFFDPSQYRTQDIEYICKMLKLNLSIIDILTYQDKTIRIHRKKILKLLHFESLSLVQQDKIKTHILWLIPKQLSPKRIFLSSIDFCWNNKIEVPSCHLLSLYITDIYNNFEEDLIKIIDQKLTDEERIKLDHILSIDGATNPSSKQKMSKSPITLIKNISNHSPKKSCHCTEVWQFAAEEGGECVSGMNAVFLSSQ